MFWVHCADCALMSLVACRLSLVACRLSLVAKNYEVRFGFVKSFCKTFCTFFVRMVVVSVGAFPAFFYHYLYYNPFLCGFQCFGKVFFNLTPKILRVQRNFDGVLMTYSFIFLGVPCGLGGFFNLTRIPMF